MIFHGLLPLPEIKQVITGIPILSYHSLLFPIVIKINGIRPAIVRTSHVVIVFSVKCVEIIEDIL